MWIYSHKFIKGNRNQRTVNVTFNANISSLHTSTLWELGFERGDEYNQNTIIEKIALTTNKHNGLLVNPLYESARVVRYDI